MIGWYNHFKADYGNVHPIVKKIQHAAKYAGLRDASLSQLPNVPMWLTTLNLWSKQIHDNFVVNNPERMDENATLMQQYQGLSSQVGSVLSKVAALEAKVSNFERGFTNLQDLIESNCMLSNAVKEAKQRESRLENELKKSKRKIEQVMKSAMTSPTGGSVQLEDAAALTSRNRAFSAAAEAHNLDGDISMEVVEDIAVEGEVMVEDAGKTAEEDIDDEEVRPAEEEEYEPPTQRRRRNAFEALDGVPEVPVLDTKDVNIGAYVCDV